MNQLPHVFQYSEPRWRKATGYHLHQAPANLRFWLTDQASLTTRLLAVTRGDFSVRVLTERWEKPMCNEAKALDISKDSTVYTRQVHLICKGVPWVFARTVIPRSTLLGPLNVLTRLGSRPLGAYLFAQTNLRREPMEIVSIAPGHRIYAVALTGLAIDKQALWGRRSVFRLGDRPLLVSEIFLPTMNVQRVHEPQATISANREEAVHA